ncbi:exodeoxyribonuclease V subunit alpha [Nocardioides bruguierae]|uniref:exodeoxyribonuclease V subunit alpha n=1 Tax=Nocardioides bruguierae TaxID=2945102 RepID=UPI002020C4F8|nr:exodeoxyribonuclease V subunit alpha [Nocardioides bruguierae]MCL8025435.1 exodeoxyribonuclease V subunit alpha [Nocardioides bruguierae]
MTAATPTPAPTQAPRLASAPLAIHEPFEAHDSRLAARATGTPAVLNAAGVLEATDVHVATRLAAVGGEDNQAVVLAVALAVRALRRGSVCVDPVATAIEVAAELRAALEADQDVAGSEPEPAAHAAVRAAAAVTWPEASAWRTALAASPLVAQGALRLEGDDLYLDRYHRLETQVADDLLARGAAPAPEVDETVLEASLVGVRGGRFSPEQEAAAVQAVRSWTTVLTGGPGTGKTTTVARTLVLLAAQAAADPERHGRPLSVALAAPTGKAATRLEEAVAAELDALGPDAADGLGPLAGVTLHRLLGWRADNQTRFRHDRGNRLGHEVVVVDESSMVDLTLMARLLEAARPTSRLLLVGDPRQLTSVGAGAVLADVVRGLSADAGSEPSTSPVAALSTNFRSTEHIKAVAEALRAGDADEVVAQLRATSAEVELVEVEDDEDPSDLLRPSLVAHARELRELAAAGEHAQALRLLDRQRLLCAHRDGPAGVRTWNRRVETWLAEEVGPLAVGRGLPGWYAGRPLLVTSNDYALDVYNGETGVAVLRPEDGRLRAWISGSDGARELAPGRLQEIETMHAMTVHKAQGSQAESVTLLLPPAGSRLLTRELFYTALTRAQRHVRVIGSEAAVRAAVATQAQRATGLAARLRAGTR